MGRGQRQPGRYNSVINAMRTGAVDMAQEVGIITAAAYWGVDKSQISRWAKERGVTFTRGQKRQAELLPCGTHASYHRGCRCKPCTEANRIYYRGCRAKMVERLKADPTLAEHGKAATYANWGCRCDPCKAAQSAANRQQAERRKAQQTCSMSE
jgi:hypothetical protein